VAQIAEVLRTHIELEDLFDDRREVGQRANDAERRSIGGTRQAPRGGQNQRVLDRLDRHAALVQLGRQQTVRAADGAAGARSRTVGFRGGKIVIQAKRYAYTVGVSAVRDLYGTLMNEGATKGVLVTTSDYGPDAYEFANGKPITLLNGSNLLHLLQKHGVKAHINLAEARQAAAPSTGKSG
jgi:hypothetical protein